MDVYVLGAGFSHAISDEMPLTSDLIDPLADYLEDDPSFGAYAAQLRIVWDLEASLTYLGEDQPWLSLEENLRKRSAYLAAIDWLAGHLYATQRHVLGSVAPSWLLALTRQWHEDQAVVISLNYDNLVEAAAQSVFDGGADVLRYRQLMPASLTFLEDRFGGYGRVGPKETATFRLLKPHGSLNWAYSPDIVGVKTQVYDSCHIGQFNRGGVVPPRWEDARTEMHDLRPLIVPPVASKTAMFDHVWLRLQWLEAGRALRDAEKVYLIGYSLPESDLAMRMFLSENIAPNDFFVVNSDPQAVDHFRHLLALGCRGSWLADDAIAKFVADLAAGNLA